MIKGGVIIEAALNEIFGILKGLVPRDYTETKYQWAFNVEQHSDKIHVEIEMAEGNVAWRKYTILRIKIEKGNVLVGYDPPPRFGPTKAPAYTVPLADPNCFQKVKAYSLELTDNWALERAKKLNRTIEFNTKLMKTYQSLTSHLGT